MEQGKMHENLHVNSKLKQILVEYRSYWQLIVTCHKLLGLALNSWFVWPLKASSFTASTCAKAYSSSVL